MIRVYSLIIRVGTLIAALPVLLLALIDGWIEHAIHIGFVIFTVQDPEACIWPPGLMGFSLNLIPFIVVLSLLIGYQLGVFWGVLVNPRVARTGSSTPRRSQATWTQHVSLAL